MLAALSSAVWFNFFLTRPYQRFTISDADDITTALLLLTVGVTVSQLAAHAGTLKLITVTDAQHLPRVHDTAYLVQAGASSDTVVGQMRHSSSRCSGCAVAASSTGHCSAGHRVWSRTVR
ncbi:DUF4118 domain-containing protein [Streptomyces phaeochromogenes]|uniref:DUF4118 domain-containing protein n=1 Tax=Streptomyces phaeochromogenes TaxID=1923 RepID=UPI00386B1435|nr:DUF4118 domain-containing protein [Streptomyces phaeochromogenes]